ncbi:hypothetical protein P7K49_007731 [Saguinus oedipus]|uniref:Uncharacterized protein n=1 Tax=Saguinus oedipus TaxID=9490 RepID=A0ABQ9VVR3_SAGOE|nr:hypothetical protein P7K49_007731 [Saguinus oedipus]
MGGGCSGWRGRRPGLSGVLEMQEWKCEMYRDDKQVPSGAPSGSPKCVQPKVTVYPAQTQPLQHHNLLVCSDSCAEGKMTTFKEEPSAPVLQNEKLSHLALILPQERAFSGPGCYWFSNSAEMSSLVASSASALGLKSQQ